MIILGVDPGSIRCGYGIIDIQNKTPVLISFGIIEPKQDKSSFPNRLKKIYDRIIQIIDEFNVEIIAIETQFYSKNAQSLIKLAQARTSVILAGLNKSLPVFEYSPREIKQSVTGRGNATKESVSYMVSAILKTNFNKSFLDSTDALATALCHFYKTTNRLLIHSNNKKGV